MLTEKQIKQLKGENELLQLELEDVNQIIKQREEELEQLKNTAATARQLQSRLDMNLLEMEQMQNAIGEKQKEWFF
jgi:predicted RNase H-like nuclease (RuvC/YqgF family)